MQNTRFKLAECDTMVSLAGAYIDRCVQQLIEGRLEAADAAKAKW